MRFWNERYVPRRSESDIIDRLRLFGEESWARHLATGIFESSSATEAIGASMDVLGFLLKKPIPLSVGLEEAIRWQIDSHGSRRVFNLRAEADALLATARMALDLCPWDSWYLLAVWSPRPNALTTVVQRSWELLERVGAVLPDLTGWRPIERGGTIAEPVVASRGDLERCLVDGRAFGPQHTVLPELGYETTLWTGDPGAPISLRLTCATSAPRYWPLHEEMILRVPAGSADDAFLTPEVARSLMILAAEIWEPEWAILSSPSTRSLEVISGLPLPFGWWIYEDQSQNGWAKSGILEPMTQLPSGTLMRVSESLESFSLARCGELSQRLFQWAVSQPRSERFDF